MTDDLVRRLRKVDEENMYAAPFTTKTLINAAADRIEALEQAIRDWADAIIDWEGIDFVERIKNEKSRSLIEAALAGEKKDD